MIEITRARHRASTDPRGGRRGGRGDTAAARADFDALGLTVDAWLETHAELRGLVLHTTAFPGWENIGGLVRHIRFVRDHHRKIGRVAIVVDGPLGTVAPRVAEHFVQAEVRGFPDDHLDDAVAWVSGRAR